MTDIYYEVLEYIVEYYEANSILRSRISFFTEETAITFIKENRHKWDMFRLVKKEIAVGGFED